LLSSGNVAASDGEDVEGRSIKVFSFGEKGGEGIAPYPANSAVSFSLVGLDLLRGVAKNALSATRGTIKVKFLSHGLTPFLALPLYITQPSQDMQWFCNDFFKEVAQGSGTLVNNLEDVAEWFKAFFCKTPE
jgi:hypothetical protein